MKKAVPAVICIISLVIGIFSGYVYYSELRREECEITAANTVNSYTTVASAKKSYDFDTVEKEYFDDALFIGDSRTVGLQKYSELQNADYFAQVGLTVYRAFNVSVSNGYSYRTLLDTLKSGNYGKVYIMFGVNEITAELETSAAEFCKLLKTVQKYQPDALIFIQANLHVGKNRSDSWEYYSNERLDEYNNLLSINADNKDIFYIDINEVYDDSEGNLAAEYTADDLHLNADCYAPWTQYLMTHAINR